VWCSCSVKTVWSMPERFRGELLTMGRYTNPASFAFFTILVFNQPPGSTSALLYWHTRFIYNYVWDQAADVRTCVVPRIRTQFVDRSFAVAQWLVRVSGTLHCVTLVAFTASESCWRRISLVAAAAHSDYVFFFFCAVYKYSYLLTCLLTLTLSVMLLK